VAYVLEKGGVRVDALVMISGGSGLNKEYISSEMKNALRVVNFSMTALYHRKIAEKLGGESSHIRKEVETRARKDYAPALAKVECLSEAERVD